MTSIYPTIHSYLDALCGASDNFKSQELKRLKIITDSLSEPVYRVSSGSLVVNAEIDGTQCSIRLFMDRESQDNYQLPTSAKRYKEELLVFSSTEMKYFDVIVEEVIRYSILEQEVECTIFENREKFVKDGKVGYKDGEGVVVIEPSYDVAYDFHEGRAMVCKDDLWGLIDTDGGYVIEPIYDELSYDNSHYCVVDLEGRYGVIDRVGSVVVGLDWDWVGECSMGMFIVKKGGKNGFVNEQNEVVIEVKYDHVSSFGAEGYALVVLDGEKFLINMYGNRVSSKSRSENL